MGKGPKILYHVKHCRNIAAATVQPSVAYHMSIIVEGDMAALAQREVHIWDCASVA